MSASTTDAELAIQILHVAGCPNVAAVRDLVQRTLTQLSVSATIEEIEGPYPSPTLLVNGADVIPRPDAIEAACRLDLPTRAHVLDALTRSIQSDGDDRQHR